MACKGLGRVFPTSLEQLLKNEYVEFEPVHVPGRLEGRFELVARKPTIFVNTWAGNLGSGRTRFSWAHECGHYFLHRRLLRRGREFHDAVIEFGDDIAAVEREANEFASEVLLPTTLVQNYWASRYIKLAFVSELADTARASVQATALKSVQVASGRCCVFFVGPDNVIRWTRPSESWRTARMKSFYWKGQQVPEGCAARATSNGFDENPVSRNIWCPNANAGRAELVESALSLGEHGRLVLVVDSEHAM